MHRERGRTESEWLQGSAIAFCFLSRLLEHTDAQLDPTMVIRQDVSESPREVRVRCSVQTENPHPLFLLTNYISGSAGEGILTNWRTVENVLVVGTNTRGCMFGNVHIDIYLPNSGYNTAFGDSVALEDFICREGIGYDPDIWVPTEYALDLVLKMCDYYGLNDPDAVPLEPYGTLPEKVDLTDYAASQY